MTAHQIKPQVMNLGIEEDEKVLSTSTSHPTSGEVMRLMTEPPFGNHPIKNKCRSNPSRDPKINR